MRLLYLSTGDPIAPKAGMDVVIREHLKELGCANGISTTAISVMPGLAGQSVPGSYQIESQDVELFAGNLLKESRGIARLVRKAFFVMRWGCPVTSYAFKSDSAAKKIRGLLASKSYEVIVIDHFCAFSNISLGEIKKSGCKLVYISHDSMALHILDLSSLKKGLLKKYYFYIEHLRISRAEKMVFRFSSSVVHISEYERQQITEDCEKHIALLPPVHGARLKGIEIDPAFKNTIVFIGAPSHLPNAHALDWILTKFAPKLAEVAPSVKIALLGARTDKLTTHSHNVKGYGFVSDELMRTMLASCVCMISPVVKGHGIKIKILEALAVGAPVFASRESLRGFEWFGMEPAIDLESPYELALKIKNLSASPSRIDEIRAQNKATWSRFLDTRTGQLARAVLTLMS